MKKYLFLLLLAAVTLMSGCSKDRQCRCTTLSNPDEVTYVSADAGFPCSKIKRMGFERLIEGNLVRHMEEVTCTEAKD